jgi:hypothetical protein
MNKRGRMKRDKGKIYKGEHLWDLDFYLSNEIYRSVQQFKDMDRYGCPGQFMDREEWDKVLDEIIYAFKEINNDYKNNPKDIDFHSYLQDGNNWQDYKETTEVKENREKYFAKIKDGKQKFIDYFGCLWD